MVPNALASLIAFLRDNQLLTPTQVAEISRSPLAQGADPRPLAKELMAREWLSAYQVNQLLQGRGGELVAGPFRLLDRLGEGPLGTVYKARHQPTGGIVAIKVIHKSKLPNQEAANRFYQHVALVQQLDHPHIGRTTGGSQIGVLHVVFMAYADGIDLAKLVRNSGPLPFAKACDYARQAALGLQFLAERGVVHRDIKPSNLYLAQSAAGETVHLLDTALAPLAAPSLNSDYFPPELVRNPHGGDGRADLYSLGCTLYFLLTGRPPFVDGTPAQVLQKHQTADPVPVTTLRSDVPPAIQTIIRKLMAKRPEERFQTAAEAATALEPFARVGGYPPPVPQSPVPLPAGPRSAPARLAAPRKPVPFQKIALGILGVLFVAALLVITLSPRINPFLRNRPAEREDAVAETTEPQPTHATVPTTTASPTGPAVPPPPAPIPKEDPKGKPEAAPKAEPVVDTAALAQQLKDKDPIIRLKAARELAKLGPTGKTALPALKEALKDPDEDVVTAVKRAVQAIGDEAPDPVAALVKQLKDKDPIVRLKAIRELTKLGAAARDALPTLQEASKDSDEDVQASAKRAILAIAAEPVTKPEPPSPTTALLKQLQDKDPLVRIQAARDLGKLGPMAKDAVPALTEALKDADEDVRSVAKRSLDAIQGTEPAPVGNPALVGIVKGLRSKSMPERIKATQQLAALGDKGREATPALLDAMMEVWPNEKEAFLDTLDKVDPRIGSPILTLLIDKSEPAKIKSLVSLGRLGSEGKNALPVLVKLLQANLPASKDDFDKDGELLVGALDTMSRVAPQEKIVSQSILAVMTAPSINGYTYLREATGQRPENPQSRLVALSLARKHQLSPQVVVPGLMRWLTDTYGLVAINELGRIGPDAKAAIPALNQLRFASDQKVREAAVAALKNIQATPAPKP